MFGESQPVRITSYFLEISVTAKSIQRLVISHYWDGSIMVHIIRLGYCMRKHASHEVVNYYPLQLGLRSLASYKFSTSF